jgi:hypothetical protein
MGERDTEVERVDGLAMDRSQRTAWEWRRGRVGRGERPTKAGLQGGRNQAVLLLCEIQHEKILFVVFSTCQHIVNISADARRRYGGDEREGAGQQVTCWSQKKKKASSMPKKVTVQFKQVSEMRKCRAVNGVYVSFSSNPSVISQTKITSPKYKNIHKIHKKNSQIHILIYWFSLSNLSYPTTNAIYPPPLNIPYRFLTHPYN